MRMRFSRVEWISGPTVRGSGLRWGSRIARQGTSPQVFLSTLWRHTRLSARTEICTSTSTPLALFERGLKQVGALPYPVCLAVLSCVCSRNRNPTYMSLTLALCALFFEVTAIQFWATRFFEEELHVSLDGHLRRIDRRHRSCSNTREKCT